jgi:hypothetical protein
MTECVKDYTKVLIKVNALTDDQMKESGMKTAYDRMVKDGNLEVCMRKCANNTPPMTAYDGSIRVSVEDAFKIVNNLFGCKGIPSSETTFPPSSFLELSTPSAHNAKGSLTVKCAFGVYNPFEKKCDYAPAYYIPGMGLGVNK